MASDSSNASSNKGQPPRQVARGAEILGIKPKDEQKQATGSPPAAGQETHIAPTAVAPASQPAKTKVPLVLTALLLLSVAGNIAQCSIRGKTTPTTPATPLANSLLTNTTNATEDRKALVDLLGPTDESVALLAVKYGLSRDAVRNVLLGYSMQCDPDDRPLFAFENSAPTSEITNTLPADVVADRLIEISKTNGITPQTAAALVYDSLVLKKARSREGEQ
jgi:hypothetical protein